MSDRNEPPNPPEYDPYESLMDLTGEEPLPALEDPQLPPATPPRSPLLIGLILGLLLVVLSVAVFTLTQDDETPSASETTQPSDASGDTLAESSDTTTPDTTVEETTTTTTTAAPQVFDPYVAAGNAIPLENLPLQTDGLGEIKLGSPAAEAVGSLIATFGDPTSDTGPIASTGEFGGCDDLPVRVVKFGALAAIVVIDPDGTETFAGYRLDLTYDGAATSAAAELETLSGFKLGFSVTQLRDIYSGFDIEILADPELDKIFELRGGSGNLLLWGPVLDSGNEGTDQVMGIYSVDASQGFC